MSCVRTASLLATATVLAVTCAAAESNPVPARSADANPLVFAIPPVPLVSPVQPRAVSSETAARLASSVPKFDFTPARQSPSEEATPATAPVDTSKPRNTIIRLPEFVIRDAKVPPPIKERELLAPRARLELALKRHPGIRVGNIFGLNNGLALAMLAEEERLERKSEFADLASLARFSDPTTNANIKREVERAFMREPDFGR